MSIASSSETAEVVSRMAWRPEPMNAGISGQRRLTRAWLPEQGFQDAG